MFLTNDRLEKPSEPEYEIMKDDKRDLMKEENMEFSKANRKKFHKSYIITIAILIASGLVLLTTVKIVKYHQIIDMEDDLFKNSASIINDTRFILSQVDEYAKNLTEYNKLIAKEYILTIRNVLKERTNASVQKIDQMVMNRTSEIESELTSFDYVITEAMNGIIDYTEKDIRQMKDSVKLIESGDASAALDKIFDDLEKKLISTFKDIDQMYSFYGNYLGNIIEHKVTNTTDRISMVLNSNRKYCDCTVIERINVCYSVSAQNGEIANQIETIEKVIGVVRHTLDELKEVESNFMEDTDEHTRQLYFESKSVLEIALTQSEDALDALLRNDDCFVGTVIQRESYKNHKLVKKFILRSFQTAIESLAHNLNKTMSDFKVVKVKHWEVVKTHLEGVLKEIGDEMYSKALLVNTTTAENDYVEKVKFTGLKLWMQDKFNNVTSVVNPLFEQRQYQIADALKYNLQTIVNQQLSFISSLSIQNYLPLDVCPLSIDFQKYVTTTLNEFVKASNRESDEKLISSATYFADDGTAGTQILPITNEDEFQYIIPVPTDDGEQEVSIKSNVGGAEDRPLMGMLKNMLAYMMKSGYEIEGPIEVIFTTDSEEK